jgi:hypothetical protein
MFVTSIDIYENHRDGSHDVILDLYDELFEGEDFVRHVERSMEEGITGSVVAIIISVTILCLGSML